MSGPDLPQPIYPPPGGGAGGAGGPGGPPPVPGAVPPAGGEPPTWSVGPATGGAGGQPPGSGSGVSPLVWVAVGVVVLVLLAGVAFAVSQDGNDTANDKPGTETTVPSGATTTTTSGGADDDIAERAATVASVQLVTQSSGPTVDCLADAFAADPDLLASVEGTSDAVQFSSAAQAESYAALIMSCASPDELTEEFVQGQIDAGQTDQVLLVCLTTDLSELTSLDWEGLIAATVQPSRQAEVVEAIQQSYDFC